jgi:DivIVA domain-containing protein
MSAERGLLRVGEYLIARAAGRLPAGMREERYHEWAAELPAILHDPDTRLAARSAARMLGYALGTIRGTALTPASTRRLMAKLANTAAGLIVYGLVAYLWTRPNTPLGWLSVAIGFSIGSLALSGSRFAYRRWRGKRLGGELAEAVEGRASAGPDISMVGPIPGNFPRTTLRPGYRIDEVDEFIARIAATLSGHALPGQAVTAADVRAVKFKTSRLSGYDEEVLDEALDRYADELDKREHSTTATDG